MDYVKNIDLCRCLSILLVVCTQKVEEFTAPVAGVYKLQCWGAEGYQHLSARGCYPGKGGYAEGQLKLNTSTNCIYICVGQCLFGEIETIAYNNTPDKVSSFQYYGGSGGGATHISKNMGGELKKFASHKEDILIVAGGGGGCEWKGYGGAGGGDIGKSGHSSVSDGRNGTGANQNSGGVTGAQDSDVKVDGSFGIGGYGCFYRTFWDYGAQGGGGWYGGGGASYAGAAGGGSSYGNSAVLIKDSYKTIDGDHEMPSPDGRTENGHTGHGACVISWILN